MLGALLSLADNDNEAQSIVRPLAQDLILPQVSSRPRATLLPPNSVLFKKSLSCYIHSAAQFPREDNFLEHFTASTLERTAAS